MLEPGIVLTIYIHVHVYFLIQITQAFQSAKQNCTWDIYSYAMSNEMEYFAEAVSSFFNVERLQSAAGGMNTYANVSFLFNLSELAEIFSEFSLTERNPKQKW